jgi:hypothetical protein
MVARKIVLVVAVVITVASFCRVLCVAKDHLAAPFDLWFETPNLCTIQSIQEGKNIYDPAMYEDLPFILTIYTPAYHYLVASVPQQQKNRFLTGRILAMACMILASLTLLFPFKARSNIAISLVAVSCFFCIRDVVRHASYLNTDSMALFFSAAAIVTTERSRNHTWITILISVLSFIAFTCKQSYIAAAVSCFFFFLLDSRRTALIFSISSLLLFLLFGIFAQLYWGYGFWFSIFLAANGPMTWQNIVGHWGTMLHQPLFVVLLVLMILASSLCFRRKNWKDFANSPYFFYLLISGFMLMLTLGKVGSDVHYFFEFILASLLWLVFLAKKFLANQLPRQLSLSLSFLCLIVVLELTCAKRVTYSFTSDEHIHEYLKFRDLINQEIKGLQAPNDRILNLDNHRSIYDVQRCPYLNDPFLYALLWNTKALDIHPIVCAIQRHFFGVIILDKRRNLDEKLGDSPMDLIIKTLLKHYQLSRSGIVFQYFVPAP